MDNILRKTVREEIRLSKSSSNEENDPDPPKKEKKREQRLGNLLSRIRQGRPKDNKERIKKKRLKRFI